MLRRPRQREDNCIAHNHGNAVRIKNDYSSLVLGLNVVYHMFMHEHTDMSSLQIDPSFFGRGWSLSAVHDTSNSCSCSDVVSMEQTWKTYRCVGEVCRCFPYQEFSRPTRVSHILGSVIRRIVIQDGSHGSTYILQCVRHPTLRPLPSA